MAMNHNENLIKVGVCGAHMSGLPLNAQLTGLGGVLVRATSTAAEYRLYKLNGFIPERPGLLRVAEDGVGIELEIWELPLKNYGAFVAVIPAPLGIGMLRLADGSVVQGFLCEHYATLNASDISLFSGWRGYLKVNN
jgi:allophanate hydrolase